MNAQSLLDLINSANCTYLVLTGFLIAGLAVIRNGKGRRGQRQHDNWPDDDWSGDNRHRSVVRRRGR